MCISGAVDQYGYCQTAENYGGTKISKFTVECSLEFYQCYPYSSDNEYLEFDSGFLNTIFQLGHSKYYEC